jgi:hypothetical protein
MYIGVLVGVALLAYLAGLFSFKVKARWCPESGATIPAMSLA